VVRLNTLDQALRSAADELAEKYAGKLTGYSVLVEFRDGRDHACAVIKDWQSRSRYLGCLFTEAVNSASRSTPGLVDPEEE
jgi:hypothetical protein